MTNTATPRTDAEVYFDGLEHPVGYWVDADFARQLERELIIALQGYERRGQELLASEAELAKVTYQRDVLLQSMELLAAGYGSDVTAQHTLDYIKEKMK
jgi:hypothetical protein